MKTVRQQEIVNFLEGLVHNRYSIVSLNRIISDKFNENIELINVSKENWDEGNDDELSDYNLMFSSDTKYTYGYYDIYILPTRRSEVYITEVSYEFNA